MLTYEIPLIPGPVSIPAAVRAAYQVDYASADLEDEFFALYAGCEAGLQAILGTQNQVSIQSGEGMLALWGRRSRASCGRATVCWPWRPASLATASARSARQAGAEVEVVGFGYDQAIDSEPVHARGAPLPPAAGDRRSL